MSMHEQDLGFALDCMVGSAMITELVESKGSDPQKKQTPLI